MIDAKTQARLNREHYETYETLTQLIGARALMPYIPADLATLEKCYPEDKHLNNIPLEKWDRAYEGVTRLRRRVRLPGQQKTFAWARCDVVCVLKHVARYHILKVRPPEPVEE